MRVGSDSDSSGLSGGERRRVTVAEALITNPSVILLDEPTSGLDSASAMLLMELLRSLASRGRTVICTIHQPRREVYDSVDRLLVRLRSAFAYWSHSEDCRAVAVAG